MADIWHYPRTELAAKYLRNIVDFGAKRQTFFAERRTGKTTFLINDLAPAAEDANFVVSYVSLWQQKDAPHLALSDALDETVRRIKSQRNVLVRFFTAKVSKLKFDGDLLGAGKLSADIEFADNARKASPDDLQALSASFMSLVEALNGAPCLLMLDEIQHLATNAKFEPLTYTLRTLLDVAPDNIKVVFTGSSRSDLDRLFANSKAPFFNSADNIIFPLLDDEFVRHLLAVYRRVTGRDLPLERLLDIFHEHRNNAYYIHALVKGMALNAITDLDEGYARLRELIAEEGGSTGLWEKLSEYEQYCFLALANGTAIFSQSNLAELRLRPGKWDRSSLQRAIGKLQDRGLISKVGHGEYAIANQSLLLWATRQP